MKKLFNLADVMLVVTGINFSEDTKDRYAILAFLLKRGLILSVELAIEPELLEAARQELFRQHPILDNEQMRYATQVLHADLKRLGKKPSPEALCAVWLYHQGVRLGIESFEIKGGA